MKKIIANSIRSLFRGITFSLILTGIIFAQHPNAVDANAKSYIRVGSLQSHISAYGAERAWTGSYYEGLIWPADYLYQDNAVIKRSYIAAKDFIDSTGFTWEYWGTYISLGTVEISTFPVRLHQSAKYEQPLIIVDGNNLSAPFMADIDEVNPDQIPDRIVTNTVNTAIGLTFTRRVLAFSQQYHDNYFIKEIILTNTGNTDYDDDIELNGPLTGVRIGWSTRYSVSRDGAQTMTDGSQKWGKHTWVSKRGEDYADHIGETFDESDPIQNWLRAGFCYLGQNENTPYSTIGAPFVTRDGRLASPHHLGLGVIHVPMSTTDSTDNPDQPAVLGWHAGDTYPYGVGNDPGKFPAYRDIWDFLDGVPFEGVGNGGNESFDDLYMTDLSVDPYTIHNDGGGTNLWIGYGPFDIGFGESITIVEVEGISGLDRQKCIEVGRKWKQAKDDPSTDYTYDMPDGSEITGTYPITADDYKNSWVLTGRDSIMKTIGRAVRNYQLGYNIPQPPPPPASFDVSSGGDRISLNWSLSANDGDADFAGYRIYRAQSKPDTVHTLLASVPSGTNFYDDESAIRGKDYYYYLTAYNDGSNNTSGTANPTGPLESSRFYTKTTEPAFLRRKQGTNLDDIVVVPNPYNIKATDLQFGNSFKDRIYFYDIPGKCIIKIYSERGDLIETINHNNGSGDEPWNLISSGRQVVVSGLYIAHFEVSEDIIDQESGELIFKKGQSTYKKFLVVR